MNSAVVALVAPFVPVLGALVIRELDSRPNLREAASLITAGVLFALVASLYPEVAGGTRPAATLVEPIPGLAIEFVVEPLGLLFAMVASGLWIVTSIYSIGYMRGNDETNQTRFYVYFALSLGATIGVAFAANAFTLFVFYELLTLFTYPLVAHHGTEEARRGARTYLVILLATSIGFLLFAIVMTWHLAGTLDFVPGGILADKASPALTGVLLALYAFGIGKAALMPFHRWLPAAMVAPTPVSALLHAVAVVKAGVFAIVKVIVYIFGVETLAALGVADWLVYVAGFTIIAGSTAALMQDNLKLRLAYSTVSQLSYVILAAALLSPLSLIGAALHIAAHAFGKITLFFAAGSISTATAKTRISQLQGVGRRMPWTMGSFAVGTLSLIGLPPTVGFISKWYMLIGALDVGNPTAAGVLAVSTLLNAANFLPIVYVAFFRPESQRPAGAAGHAADDAVEAPVPILIGLVIPAVLTVLAFALPGTALGLAGQLIGRMP